MQVVRYDVRARVAEQLCPIAGSGADFNDARREARNAHNGVHVWDRPSVLLRQVVAIVLEG